MVILCLVAMQIGETKVFAVYLSETECRKRTPKGGRAVFASLAKRFVYLLLASAIILFSSLPVVYAASQSGESSLDEMEAFGRMRAAMDSFLESVRRFFSSTDDLNRRVTGTSDRLVASDPNSPKAVFHTPLDASGSLPDGNTSTGVDKMLAEGVKQDFVNVEELLSSRDLDDGEHSRMLAEAIASGYAYVHYVEKGETLYGISRKYGIGVNVIASINRIDDIHQIRSNQALVIPNQNPGYVIPISDAELDLLERLVEAEAGGEPYEGKVAVAAVVLNRLKHPGFPNTITDVIYEPRQFTPAINGKIEHMVPSEETKASVRDALSGHDPSWGSLYFYNPAEAVPEWGAWHETLIFVRKIANHHFSME